MRVLSRLVLMITLAAFIVEPVTAASLNNSDLNFAFGGKTVVKVQKETVKQRTQSVAKVKNTSPVKTIAQTSKSATNTQLASIKPLSSQEMKDTEGAWIPLAIWGARAAYTGYRVFRASRAVRSTVRTYRSARRAVGPRSAWVRYGNSYSRSGGFNTRSLRWGSNAHHRQRIGSPRLRSLNARLHNSRISSRSWRTRDTGHFHFRRR